MTNYSKQWSSATPGFLIFLIDQSQSMSEIWTGQITKADFTANAVNRTINELIATNAAGESVKDRVFISLIGYGGQNEAKDLRSDYLSKYADKPERVESITKKVNDGNGNLVDMVMEMPIFLDSKSEGSTPMSRAFALAKKAIQGWIEKKNDNPVPVIINISDGYPYTGDPAGTPIEIEKTILTAKEIMQLRTLDGNPLIFNVHIGGDGQEIQFPENKFELPADPMAELLFEISSQVPETYKKAAKDQKLRDIGDNAKGFISNAQPQTLIKFINFGSSGGTSRSTN